MSVSVEKMYRVEQRCAETGERGLVATRRIAKGEKVIDAEQPLVCTLTLGAYDNATEAAAAPDGGLSMGVVREMLGWRFDEDQVAFCKAGEINPCLRCRLVRKVLDGDEHTAAWTEARLWPLFTEYQTTVKLDRTCKRRMNKHGLSERHRLLHCILDSNVHELTATEMHIETYGCALFPQTRLINHSCRPNCAQLVDTCFSYVVALRDIEEGEEITHSYCGPIQIEKMNTHGLIRKKFNFVCKCAQCAEEGYCDIVDMQAALVRRYVEDAGLDKCGEMVLHINRVAASLPSPVEGICSEKRMDTETSRRVILFVMDPVIALLNNHELSDRHIGMLFVPMHQFLRSFIFVCDPMSLVLAHHGATLLKTFYGMFEQQGRACPGILLCIHTLLAVTSCFVFEEDRDKQLEAERRKVQCNEEYHRYVTYLFGEERGALHMEFVRKLCMLHSVAHMLYLKSSIPRTEREEEKETE